jgi:nitrogen fixation NifU-like protein
MSDLKELYQEVILDHNRNPRNFRVLQNSCRHADGHNPLCGDQVTIYLKLNGDVIEDATFKGNGCAISMASASLMTETIKGKTLSEVRLLFKDFQGLVTGRSADPPPGKDAEKLVVFHGVSEFPVRVKCATLPWHTLQAAATDASEPASTE